MANIEDLSLPDLIERVTEPAQQGQDLAMLQLEIVERIKSSAKE
jgi:hypothetical protein